MAPASSIPETGCKYMGLRPVGGVGRRGDMSRTLQHIVPRAGACPATNSNWLATPRGPCVPRGAGARPHPGIRGLPNEFHDRRRHRDLVLLKLFCAVVGRGQLALEAGGAGRNRRTRFFATDLGARKPEMAPEQRS